LAACICEAVCAKVFLTSALRCDPFVLLDINTLSFFCCVGREHPGETVQARGSRGYKIKGSSRLRGSLIP
jgi:hypothetical protein